MKNLVILGKEKQALPPPSLYRAKYLAATALMAFAMNAHELRAQATLTNPIQYPPQTVGTGSTAIQPYVMTNIYRGEFPDPTVVNNSYLLNGKNADDQLRFFPKPRYKPSHDFKPNNGSLLGLVNMSARTKPTTVLAADHVVDLRLQLARKWNYYFTIFEGRGDCNTNPNTSWQDYMSYRLIKASNLNPTLKTAGHVNVVQLKNGVTSPVPATSLPNPPANSYNSTNNAGTPTYGEANPAAPTFQTKYYTNPDPPQNDARQNSNLLATKYYVHNVGPVAQTTGLVIYVDGTPCSPSDPCYFEDNTWKKYKIDTALHIPKKNNSPLAGRLNGNGLQQPYYGETFRQDGRTQNYNIQTYLNYMTRNPGGTKIDYLTENGEGRAYNSIPAHVWFANNDMVNGYSNDPIVSAQFTDSAEPDQLLDFTGAGYLNPGDPLDDRVRAMKSHLAIKHSYGFTDLTKRYTNEFVNTEVNNGTIGTFSYYGVDGNRVGHNFLWEGTRRIQSLQRGQRYAAPDIYPLNTSWYKTVSAYRSWDFLNENRYSELKDVNPIGILPGPSNSTANDQYAFYKYDKDNGAERNPDYLFSPWVSAGWAPLEFMNIRPAQWLGLLKAMSVSGAEYYNVGFFESTHDAFKSMTAFDSIGRPITPYYNLVKSAVYSDIPARKFAQGAYQTSQMIWHATTPSYAQAIMTRAENAFLVNGLPNTGVRLLSDDFDALSTTNLPPFNYDLAATTIPYNANASPLVVARRWLTGTNVENYLITATLQPANGKDNAAYFTNTNFTVPFYNPSIPPNFTSKVEFSLPRIPATSAPLPTLIAKARTQGSTYVYVKNPNGIDPVFYQLDGWHQWEHPYHWDQNFLIEAELPDNLTGNSFVKTLRPTGAASNDFSEFVSYVPNTQNCAYNFEPTQPGTYKVHIRCVDGPTGLASASTGLAATITKNGVTQNLNTTAIPPCTSNNKFEWRSFPVTFVVSGADVSAGTVFTLNLVGASNVYLIDKYYIVSGNAVPPNDFPAIYIGCGP